MPCYAMHALTGKYRAYIQATASSPTSHIFSQLPYSRSRASRFPLLLTLLYIVFLASESSLAATLPLAPKDRISILSSRFFAVQ